MSDVTRRGVYKDLSKSPYQLVGKDLIGREIVYKFSSQFKLDKFKKEVNEAGFSLAKCLDRVYGFNVDTNTIYQKLMERYEFYHYKEFKQ